MIVYVCALHMCAHVLAMVGISAGQKKTVEVGCLLPPSVPRIEPRSGLAVSTFGR